MIENEFKWIKPHIEDHRRMVHAMEKFMERADDSVYAATHFCSDLEQLLINHIDHYDRQYEIPS